ncbi:MAG: hypothetical protein ABEH47_03560 [Haloferacaceae archaeon]
MAEATATEQPVDRAVRYLRGIVYTLAGLIVFSLLVVGTIGVITEIKDTWHWSIHLESTISYMGAFVGVLLAALVPALCLLLVGRWVTDG